MVRERKPPACEEEQPDWDASPPDAEDWPHDVPADPVPADPPTVRPGDSADEDEAVVPDLPSDADEGGV